MTIRQSINIIARTTYLKPPLQRTKFIGTRQFRLIKKCEIIGASNLVIRRQMTETASKIDGKKISEEILEELAKEVATLKEKGVHASLAAVQVGGRKDSSTYVRMKKLAAKKAGIEFQHFELPEHVSQKELLDLIEEINNNDKIHGLIVQLPLPEHLDSALITQSVSPDKDVDGLHTQNLSGVIIRGQTPQFEPCTPLGCIELLKRTGISISGKNAVVLGRSNIVGLPVAHLLLRENATVTICHSQTRDFPAILSNADIIVAALGKAEFVKGAWIKKGAVVIDVGINAVPDDTKKVGYRLVGDVDYEAASQQASHITPVPGGVGPMTVAMLLRNTVNAAHRKVQ